MADQDSQRQVIATVTVPLPTSGSPSGLRIRSDGADSDCAADWTVEYADKIGSTGDRVTATVRNPSRPMVSGKAQIGVTA